eukprot:jgi/Botrbrau1/12277/Bobra.0323s0017.1
MHGVPRQDILTLPLPPYLRQILINSGLKTVADYAGLGPVELARDLGISQEDALLVLNVSNIEHFVEKGLTDVRSAAQLYEKEASAKKIITFCPGLDGILGGGVCTGQITEFCGAPGVGKTQLGIQLSVDVQIPSAFKGVDGTAVYIDTEGSFMVERVEEIAEAMVKHVHKIVRSTPTPSPAQQAAIDALAVDGILSHIHLFRVRDHVEQLAVVHLLSEFLRDNRKVRLVVMDSITFHFRQDFLDMAQRTRLLSQMAQQLLHLAQLHDVAVVLMNQVTTRISEGKQSSLVPALGESWAHAATTRVILYWQDQTRNAFLYKSPSLPAKSAQYLVTSEGIRGQRPQKRSHPDELPESGKVSKLR